MSPWEMVGRAKKVARMAALIPFGVDDDSIAGAADFIEALSPKDRNCLARAASVRVPSEATWQALVTDLRARRPLVDFASPKALEAGAVARTAVRGRGVTPVAGLQR